MPGERKTEDLANVSKFFLAFKFFNELRVNHGDDVLVNVLRCMQIQRVSKGTYLID